MSTPKEKNHDVEIWTVAPQMVMISALGLGVLWKILHWYKSPAPLTVILAFMLIGQHWILVVPIRQLFKKWIKGIKRESVKTDLKATSTTQDDLKN